MNEFLQEYVHEARGNVENFERTLLALENDLHNISLTSEALRYAHSIKGGASFFGFEKIVNLSHELESILSQITNNEFKMSDSLFDLLLNGKDLIENMISDITNIDSYDVDKIIDDLNKITSNNTNDSTGEYNDVIGKYSNRNNEQYFNTAKSNKNKLYQIEFILDQESSTFFEQFDTLGKYVLTSNFVKGHKILCFLASEFDKSLFETLYDFNSEQIKKIKLTTFEDLLEILSEFEKVYAPKEVLTLESTEEPVDEPTTKKENVRQTIRVDVGSLDNILNIVGEMVLSRNQLVRKINSDKKYQSEFGNIIVEYNRLISLLQDEVLKTRTQEISTVFNRFPRVIRDISKKLGKKINLEISDGGVEVDKSVIELIYDPLTHIIRNAADHGIESPEERASNNKYKIGTIKLSAKPENGYVIIEISDDGSGIDIEAVKKKAIEKGVRTKDQLDLFTEQEIVNLIFNSGFTTTDKVTETSGRGVGMDVVKKNIEKISGSVIVTSNMHKGTTFTLKLPMTVAIISGISVIANDYEFIIPRISITEFIQLRSDDRRYKVDEIQDKKFLYVRDEIIPIVEFDKLMDIEYQSKITKFVIIQTSIYKYAIPVEQILGSEEILVKPLPSVIRSGVYNSVTISSLGEVVPILDVENIAKIAQVGEVMYIEKEENVEESLLNTNDFLQFGIENQGYYVIPVQVIKKIFNVRNEELNYIGEHIYYYDNEIRYQIYDVKDYFDLDFETTEHYEEKFIITIDHEHNIGLLVDNISNVRKIVTENTFKDLDVAGINGTYMYNGKMFVEIDLDYILNNIKIVGKSQSESVPIRVDYNNEFEAEIFTETAFIKEETETEINIEIEDDLEADIEFEIEEETETDVDIEIEDEVEEPIEDEVEEQIIDQIEADIEFEIKEETETDVDIEIEDEVEEQIIDQIEADIEAEIEEETETEMDIEIEDEVEEQIIDLIEADIEAEIEEVIETEIDIEIEDKVEEQIIDQIESDIEAEIEEETETDVDIEIEDEVEEQMIDQIEAEIEAEIEEEIETEMDIEIEDEVEEQIIYQIESEIEAEIEEEIETEIDIEIEDEVEEQIIYQIESDIESEIEEETETQEDIEIKDEVEEQMIEQIKSDIEAEIENDIKFEDEFEDEIIDQDETDFDFDLEASEEETEVDINIEDVVEDHLEDEVENDSIVNSNRKDTINPLQFIVDDLIERAIIEDMTNDPDEQDGYDVHSQLETENSTESESEVITNEFNIVDVLRAQLKNEIEDETEKEKKQQLESEVVKI